MISTVTTPTSPPGRTILLKGEVLRGAAGKVPSPPEVSASTTSASAPAPTPSSSTSKRELPFLSRAEIARRICAGQALLIRHGRVLNVSAWGASHPGGELALLHFVGRDASDEIAAYHSDATLARMDKFAVGRVGPEVEAEGWAPLTPPVTLGLGRHADGVPGHWRREGNVRLAADVLDGQAQADDVVRLTPEMIEPPAVEGIDRRRERARSKAYHDLKARVTDAGLFNPPGPLAGYGKDVVRYLLLGGSAFALFFLTTGWAGQMASAALLGLCWQQITCELGRVGEWLEWSWHCAPTPFPAVCIERLV
jgi:delta8-fatty-acid desaturase